jgi:hypothetical protein
MRHDATHEPGDVEAMDDVTPGMVSAPVFDPRHLHGCLGEYVRLWEPHTEAAPVAIWAAALAALAAIIGRSVCWPFGGSDHPPLLWPLLIGASGAGRKGTALSLGVYALLARVAPDFARSDRLTSGLSSGEGLIDPVRDPMPERQVRGVVRPPDPGGGDYRLLVVENEMAGPLESMSREGNRLSPLLRDAWDGRTLKSMTVGNPQQATNPNIVVIGCITAPELRRIVGKSESVRNGLLNRTLPIHTGRARLLPEDSRPGAHALDEVCAVIAARLTDASAITRVMAWSPEAAVRWRVVYERLALMPEAAGDVHRSLCERGAPYVRRVAMTLAALDNTHIVGTDHLTAALALWDYAAATWRYVFPTGEAFSPLATRLLEHLARAGHAGLTRSAIRTAAGSNNVPAEKITEALTQLTRASLAYRTTERTAGRSAERWRHARFLGRDNTEGVGTMGEKGSNPDAPSSFAPIAPIPPTPRSDAAGIVGPGVEQLPASYWDSLNPGPMEDAA